MFHGMIRRRLRWLASTAMLCSVATLGGYTITATAGAEPLPPWLSEECTTDGSDISDSEQCTPTGPSESDGEPVPRAHCAGAVACDASWEELKARGVNVARMRREFQESADRFVGGGPRARAGGFTGYYGENDFYLADAAPAVCDGTVKYHDHCGWLYNHWQQYVDGQPKANADTTIFPARAGNNEPEDDWLVGVGPLPNADWESSSPSLNHFHWGWQNGKYAGYTARSDDSFDPGLWPLDPWTVWKGQNKTGTKRCCFEIHGGSDEHNFWNMPTAGCVRLPKPAMNSLRSLWFNYTDNKRSTPGPDMGVHFRAP